MSGQDLQREVRRLPDGTTVIVDVGPDGERTATTYSPSLILRQVTESPEGNRAAQLMRSAAVARERTRCEFIAAGLASGRGGEEAVREADRAILAMRSCNDGRTQ